MSSEQKPIVSLFVVIFMSFGCYLIVPNILMLLMAAISDASLQEILSAIHSPVPEPRFQWIYMMVLLFASGFSFIVVPLLFIKYYEKNTFAYYFNENKHSIKNYTLLLAITLCVMMVNSMFIEWNMSIEFPEPFHNSLQEMEKDLEEATRYITDFYSLPYFMFAFVVIAIVPAVGEELLFRGLIQKYSERIFGNVHVAIWISAFIFSAFHMQFFGFIPRVLLGAFFGYMFYISGSLWYAIGAHFINNGFTIIMLYLYQLEIIEYDIENTESISLESVGIFSIMGIILLWLFNKQFQNGKRIEA